MTFGLEPEQCDPSTENRTQKLSNISKKFEVSGRHLIIKNYVWQILVEQNHKVMKEGKILETTEENLEELTQQANVFALEKLPVLKGLGVI